MTGSDLEPWKHLLDQADRCLRDGDRTGAEVHLVAALEHARRRDEPSAQAAALIRLARLRRAQRRALAAERILDEAEALLVGADGASALRDALAAERAQAS